MVGGTMSDPDPHRDDDEPRHSEPERAPFWKHPGLAIVAALVAILGLVWRCA